MKEIAFDSLTNENLIEQSRVLIDLIRTNYPKLDLRRGTVLRDLLIDTDSAIRAWFVAQAEEQRLSSSLLSLLQQASSGESVTTEDVDAILSNFNMRSASGTRAKGFVRIFVENSSRHTVLAGVKFRTLDAISVTVTKDTVAVLNPVDPTTQTQLFKGVSNYWFVVPVEADAAGSNGNISQGIALEPDIAISDFISADAYKTFSGGSDLEELDKTVSRIKESLSVRNLTSKTAIAAQLRDEFDTTDDRIIAVSVCGYGNEAQIRDKHNLFGVGCGGRVDIYVRNFTELPIIQSKTIYGVLNDNNKYVINLDHSDFPGVIFVYSVSDPDTLALSSYDFDVLYSSDTGSTWHDIKTSASDNVETANSIWRNTQVIVKNVDDEGVTGTKKEFRVSLAGLPSAEQLQSFVDNGVVRHVGADCVVRGPMIVNMSVNAVVRYSYDTPFDVERARTEICNYVNNTGFVGRITRSEIASILRNLGAASVDLYDEEGMLYGFVYDAAGIRHELSGDALDIDTVKTPEHLLTKDTTVFVLEKKNVQIKTIAIS